MKVTFLNNAGFDWNLLADAIEFQDINYKPISANDLMTRYKHAIRAPINYRFMNVSVCPSASIEEVNSRPSSKLVSQIPSEYTPYISIKPSNHTIDTAPLQVR